VGQKAAGGDRKAKARAKAGEPTAKAAGPTPAAPRRKRARGPWWANVCAIVGALLMLVSGGVLISGKVLLSRFEDSVTEADLFGDKAAAAPQPKSDIKGPLNILLAGIDPRDSEPNWIPRADSIIVLHVPKGLTTGYLFSLPRDLWVQVPRFEKANYAGGRDKLAHAMFNGSRVPGQAKPDPAKGFELLAKTVSNYTGIDRFDAGAIVNFTGFKRIVDAMGGVTMYVDQNVKSIHMQPDGQHRKPSGIRGAEGAASYIGPRKEYKKGTQHLKGWEALDYTRQRYIPGGDYARQRHQQQFIRAMADQALSKDVVTNPKKLDSVLRAAGNSLIFNGRGNSVIEFGFALRNLRSDSIVMMKLPGRSIIQNGDYIGEELVSPADDFFTALREGGVESFVLNHPELVNRSK
jgi:polyisoprenyl-teichoic acid--peptidoglycan teichoic acid transferase